MNILENIIRKALFNTTQRLNEQRSRWRIYPNLRKSTLNKVEALAPTAVKGFRLDLQSVNATDKNISRNEKQIANWLTSITNTDPDVPAEKREINPIGSESRFPQINQYLGGNYVFVLGQDTKETRAERRLNKNDTSGGVVGDTISGVSRDIFNVIVFPLNNLIDILDNVNIDKIAINAWKYPSAKGTQFETARSVAQLGLTTALYKIGQSPLFSVQELVYQQEEYQELLPIAREMKNTPQPNGNANRDSDIDDAIAAMESFLNDWTDWKALAKAIAPNPVSSGGLFMASTNTTEKSVEEYEKWDATDSKQAAELSGQAIANQAAEEDASLIAAGQNLVEVEDYEYETADSPTGKISFTGQMTMPSPEDLIKQTPFQGYATDADGRSWLGTWNENGNFKTGTGYKKFEWGGEWTGGIVNGFISGTGTLSTADSTYTGIIKVDKNNNNKIVMKNGTFNSKWTSNEGGSDKEDSYSGKVVDGKWTDGTWTKWIMKNGVASKFIYTGTFSANNIPNNGTVTDEAGKQTGKFVNGVWESTK